MGDDSAYTGSPIIENGKITGNLNTRGSNRSDQGNYWSMNPDDYKIFVEHSEGYTIDAIYGNAKSIPIWDDPTFYIVDGGPALGKGAYTGITRGIGKMMARKSAKETSKMIIKEVAELGPNNINHT